MQFVEKIKQQQAIFKEARIAGKFSDDFNLRIHRSLSWLKMAAETDDLDMKFIGLWIGFNAAYARELNDDNPRDKATFHEYLLRICAFDHHHKVYDLIWKKFSGAIRLLLDNPFVFQAFWDFHNGKIDEAAYLKKQMVERESILSSLEEQKTGRILIILFERLYTLRNQILHGGATYRSRVNREQVKDGCAILSDLIPMMLEIMADNHDQIDWGKPFYPVVKD